MHASPISPLRQTIIRSSILRRQMTQALLLTGFIVLLLTTLSFLVTRSMIEQSALSQLSTVAAVSEDSLNQTLQSHRERATLLSSHTEIHQVLESNASPGTIPRLLVQLQRDEPSLAGIEVYNANGRLIDSAGNGAGLNHDSLMTPQYQSVTDATGWRWYDVRTPVWGTHDERIGYLTLRYDARPMIDRLTSIVPSLGTGSEVLIVRTESGDLQIFHLSNGNNAPYILSLGRITPTDSAAMPWITSVNGKEGYANSVDERGQDILVAYRYLPTLGWGMALILDQRTALAGVHSLAFVHASIGTLLLLLAALLAWLLARQLTEPLRSLTERVQKLRPDMWTMHRAVHTGDEVEVLESVLVDMAARLQNVYRSQETEIRNRTEELRRQYALDRTILDTIEYGVISVDRSGKITGINPAGLRLLGEKQDHVTGKQAASVLTICSHRGEISKGMHPLLACIKSGKAEQSPVSAHLNVRRDDDTLLPILYTVSPFGNGKKIEGAVMVFQDVTEERKVDYLKSEFISLASHQLRTPLSALRWYTELLADSKADLNADQRSYVKEMQQSTERMTTLLTSLLRASRMEGQNLKPEIQMVNVVDVLHELHDDFLPLIQEAGLSCSLSLPRHVVKIATDPTLLRIVLQNLLSNAVKYSVKNSKKAITVELVERASGIAVSVHDQGLGIPLIEQSRIFQKFFRAKNVRKMDTDGNGLGLYITRTIVERLGGTIMFKSTENKGSEFTISLPKGKKKL